ncbi:Uncharacterised protein [Mycobacteroides abscessus subsp. abscessus]|nr:Uncharacterised protein [Mycobacteroides abscessus subsp. abscessus]
MEFHEVPAAPRVPLGDHVPGVGQGGVLHLRHIQTADPGGGPAADRRAVGEHRCRALGADGVRGAGRGVVVPGEELRARGPARHRQLSVPPGPGEGGADVGALVLRGVGPLQVPGLHLPEAVQLHGVDAAHAHQRSGREVGAHQGGDEDPVHRLLCERVGDGLGLRETQLGETGTGGVGVQKTVDVGGGLPVADEDQAHGFDPFTPRPPAPPTTPGDLPRRRRGDALTTSWRLGSLPVLREPWQCSRNTGRLPRRRHP